MGKNLICRPKRTVLLKHCHFKTHLMCPTNYIFSLYMDFWESYNTPSKLLLSKKIWTILVFFFIPLFLQRNVVPSPHLRQKDQSRIPIYSKVVRKIWNLAKIMFGSYLYLILTLNLMNWYISLFMRTFKGHIFLHNLKGLQLHDILVLKTNDIHKYRLNKVHDYFLNLKPKIDISFITLMLTCIEYDKLEKIQFLNLTSQMANF